MKKIDQWKDFLYYLWLRLAAEPGQEASFMN